MYLLDTGVVFELRKARAGRTDPVFASWASGLARQNLFISTLTLLELDNGAARVAPLLLRRCRDKVRCQTRPHFVDWTYGTQKNGQRWNRRR